MGLPILFQDHHYVAVHKPADMAIHRNEWTQAHEPLLLQTVHQQLGKFIFPVHRLDKATSGVVLFALTADAARRMCGEFEARRVYKRYHAVVRGWLADSALLDRPLIEEKGREPAAAQTYYRRLAQCVLPIAVGRYAQSRYSLVEAYPYTGRMHQIRKHFSGISHPIVGDRAHGDDEHNRMFQQQLGCSRMLLCAQQLRVLHPYTGQTLDLQAEPEPEFSRMLELLGLHPATTSAEPPMPTLAALNINTTPKLGA